MDDSQDNTPDNSAPLQSRGIQKTSKIIITDLELMMFIGVFEEEKQAKQRVLISVELDIIPNENWQDDNVENVLSYADIIDHIKQIALEGHIHLVETFTEKICEMCLAYDLVKSAQVKVTKPDIITDAGAVGVEISAQKS